uniref:Uncharacterized protein n=1 Tax=Romanomermis culicivorax TaxID=13658 RepID=A0A915I6S0_ROMCU
MVNNTGRANGGSTTGPSIDSMTPLSSPGNDDHSWGHVTGSQSAENVSVAGGSAMPMVRNIREFDLVCDERKETERGIIVQLAKIEYYCVAPRKNPI